ncbi:MAG: aldolase/citrate lyase family protein [Planctomycetota bacterium]
MRQNRLARKLERGESTVGMWVTVESATVTEIAVALELDWVVIDMEHGHLDYRDVMDHLRALRGTDTVALVRVPAIEATPIKRVLDMGAHGLILPLVRSSQDVERAFLHGRYPPRGQRGIGGERCMQWGMTLTEYLQVADDETLLIPLIETRDAAENIDEILSVPDLKAIFFGPNDLSATCGHVGQWEGPGVADLILEIRAKAEAKGIAAGVMGTSVENSIQRRDQGFHMVGLGADMNLMIRALRENLAALGRDRRPNGIL